MDAIADQQAAQAPSASIVSAQPANVQKWYIQSTTRGQKVLKELKFMDPPATPFRMPAGLIPGTQTAQWEKRTIAYQEKKHLIDQARGASTTKQEGIENLAKAKGMFETAGPLDGSGAHWKCKDNKTFSSSVRQEGKKWDSLFAAEDAHHIGLGLQPLSRILIGPPKNPGLKEVHSSPALSTAASSSSSTHWNFMVNYGPSSSRPSTASTPLDIATPVSTENYDEIYEDDETDEDAEMYGYNDDDVVEKLQWQLNRVMAAVDAASNDIALDLFLASFAHYTVAQVFEAVASMNIGALQIYPELGGVSSNDPLPVPNDFTGWTAAHFRAICVKNGINAFDFQAEYDLRFVN